ncbi:excalibur calcium-binding domain-containing protein [Deinococcus planocerae]|uniref:excalibur calcium-binding domain-containing protein n=1 Tax=Deinococcus planocerae TaxID=1737569 RepID=UPI000C7F17E9|nr:excalibur calcium-binding domain-containing protein [Deinococcus planocerae]
MRHLALLLALSVTLLGVSEAATALTTTPVNLRRAPSETGRILGVVPGNTLLLVACQGQWCRTTYAGQAGYVARSFVRPVTGSARLTGPGAVYYRSCAAMRAANAAPVRLGKPGYRTALDRNGNGVACENGE